MAFIVMATMSEPVLSCLAFLSSIRRICPVPYSSQTYSRVSSFIPDTVLFCSASYSADSYRNSRTRRGNAVGDVPVFLQVPSGSGSASLLAFPSSHPYIYPLFPLLTFSVLLLMVSRMSRSMGIIRNATNTISVGTVDRFRFRGDLLHQILIAFVGGLISGTVCFDCFYNFHKNQFINGVVYGFLIVLILIIIEICITCDLCRIWSIIVAFLGAVCFFLVAIFILEYVGGYPRFANRMIYLRLLIAGLLCLLLTGVFILNIYLLVKGEPDCNYPCSC